MQIRVVNYFNTTAVEICSNKKIAILLSQIREYEWCHPSNKRSKFNVPITTYKIMVKDKVSLECFIQTANFSVVSHLFVSY